jgi:pimeloyl-ACP methyl ester carboxylesterase
MKQTFVLIHGAFHGGWCWEKLAPRLRACGHPVIAPDLPGMGNDGTRHGQISLASTADFVANIVRAQPAPVVLVGHSMGGMVIAEVAERLPAHILGLVFVTAVLRTAESTVTARGEAPPMTRSADGHSMVCDAGGARERFYNTTDPALADAAISRLRPQPVATMSAPLSATLQGFGKLQRAFVECTQDRAISLVDQRAMQAALPCETVFTLETDHSPFLCAPDRLAECLLTAAVRFAEKAEERPHGLA